MIPNERVNLYTRGKGFKLAEPWAGFRNQNKYICDHGHTFEATNTTGLIYGKKRCPECVKLFKQRAHPSRYTRAEVEPLLKSTGWTLVGEWYGNLHESTFACPEGHTVRRIGKHILHYQIKCSVCMDFGKQTGGRGKKLSASAINQRLAPRALRLIGKWHGMAYHNTFQCSLNHEPWEAIGISVLYLATGCPECARIKIKARFQCEVVDDEW